MKKCLNCNKIIKDTDIYCRHCGIKIQSNKNYIITDIIIVLLIIGLIGMIALFAASYIINK